MARLKVIVFNILIISFSIVFYHIDGLSETTSEMIVATRHKRGVMDSTLGIIADVVEAPFWFINDIIQGMFNFMWNIVMLPINIINSILGTIFAPFIYTLKIVTWPIRYEIGRNSTDPSLTDAIKMNVRQGIINLMWRVFAFIKSTILPKFDALIVKLEETNGLSNNTKTMLKSIHSTYQILHMLKIVR